MTWLARNRIALIVIAVCAPGLVGVLYGFEVLSSASKTTEVVEIAVGDSVEILGYEWEITQSVEIPGKGRSANDIPLGTSLVAAIIKVTPVDDSPGDDTCDVSLSSRSSGEELSWQTVGDPTVYDYGLLPESKTYCSLEGEPFSYEMVFLAPKGVYGTSTVDLDLGGSETVYRFDLEN
jgi:hypothetical protein